MVKLSQLRKEGSFKKVKKFINKRIKAKYKEIVDNVDNENESENILQFMECFKKIKNTVLVVAVHTDNLEVVKLMLILGADPNKAFKFSYGCNSIILAVMNRSYKMLELLITKSQIKIDFNLRVRNKVCVNNGKTALNLICCDSTNDGLRILKLLIDNKADIDLQDLDGNSNLSIAVCYGNNTVLNYLLKKGADPDLETFCCGRTPLMSASLRGNEIAVKDLIDNKANLNMTEKHNGFTALILSLLEGKLECAKILVENYCDLNIEDKHGYTALRIAVCRDYKDVITGLIMLGSKVNEDIINDATCESTKIFLRNADEIRGQFVKSKKFGNITVIKEKQLTNEFFKVGKMIQDMNRIDKKVKVVNFSLPEEEFDMYCHEIDKSV